MSILTQIRKGVRLSEDVATSYVNHVKQSLINARSRVSKINSDALTLEGMSGVCTRHFYNNLASIPDVCYLEIGLWKGSTFCSAMSNNEGVFIGIDNWSQWGGQGTRNAFFENVNKFAGKNKVRIIEQDSWKVDILTLPKINVYVYDGDHDHDDQYNALAKYLPCLNNIFIFVVDDWNAPDPRAGTFDAIKQLNLRVLFYEEVRTTQDGSHPAWGTPEQLAWHNGCGVFVLQK